jgi:formate dehydrogenase subunit gamma
MARGDLREMTAVSSPTAPDQAHWDAQRAHDIIAAHSTLEGAALPILHALHEEFGFVPNQSEPLIADALNISRAEVHGVISFYHDFRRQPAGRHILKICRAEACQSVDGAPIAEQLLRRLGIAWGETTADGSLTVEPVYCLGLCACAPAALLDGEPIARLDEDRLLEIAQEARRA